MADNSAIEWTEATWNPVTGCDKVSPGCAHCYAETFAERWRGIPGHPYEQGFALKLWPQRLEQPLSGLIAEGSSTMTPSEWCKQEVSPARESHPKLRVALGDGKEHQEANDT